jgi:hypothetical protein
MPSCTLEMYNLFSHQGLLMQQGLQGRTAKYANQRTMCPYSLSAYRLFDVTPLSSGAVTASGGIS